MSDLSSLVVVGHKNPDTDAVCSAIAYARLKTRQGVAARPFRAGNLNAQTKFVLDRFACPPPPLLTDLYPKISHIMIPRQDLFVLRPTDSLSAALRIIVERSFAFLPVVDDNEVCLGKVTALRLARLLEELPGEWAGVPTDEALRNTLQRPVGEFLESPEPLFNTEDLVRDAERRINNYNIGGFIVLDTAGHIGGVVTRVNFLTKARFPVVLVDHNEFSQAVPGIEEAELVEVVDHHRIGVRSTSTPITFINRALGSTCTIVADMYRSAGLTPTSDTAGLMLAAILSDTVILKSPTTTPLDIEIAWELAETSGLAVDTFGEELFRAGSEVSELTASEIVGRDQKTYDEAGFRFSISQIETVGFTPVEEREGEILQALSDTIAAHGLDFACLMVTDITRETTRLALSGNQGVQDAIQYPTVSPGVFEMPDVLSRKKQVLPYLLDLLARL
ncbi:MAG: DHHA2 domain-containing protein [Spirochaetaceae bacterium]